IFDESEARAWVEEQNDPSIISAHNYVFSRGDFGGPGFLVNSRDRSGLRGLHLQGIIRDDGHDHHATMHSLFGTPAYLSHANLHDFTRGKRNVNADAQHLSTQDRLLHKRQLQQNVLFRQKGFTTPSMHLQKHNPQRLRRRRPMKGRGKAQHMMLRPTRKQEDPLHL
ncbi:unnamed protein product, partial [Amoebophrya sp. A25]